MTEINSSSRILFAFISSSGIAAGLPVRRAATGAGLVAVAVVAFVSVWGTAGERETGLLSSCSGGRWGSGKSH